MRMRLARFAGRRAVIILNRRPDFTQLYRREIDRSRGSVIESAERCRFAALGLIAHAEPRAAYDATPRFAEPFCTTRGEDLSDEAASNRGADFLELRLLSLKSHFFRRTYCFPRLESSPDSIISAISRLTIGREQPIISARSS